MKCVCVCIYINILNTLLNKVKYTRRKFYLAKYTHKNTLSTNHI